MRNNKDVILIPYWIHEILQRNNLSLADCLDLPKIKPLMSFNDLACFYAMQREFQQIVGIDYYESTTALYSSIDACKDNEIKEFFKDTLIPLSSDESIKNELKNRLFYSESKSDSYKEPFKTHDLSPTVCGVVIYPGYFTTSNNYELQKDIIEAILRVFYVYGTSSEVSSTIFFKRYLELISGR